MKAIRLLLIGFVACGGRAGGATAEGDAGDAALNDGSEPAPDAGWTQCTSPSGFAVCGGPNQCPSASAQCPQCIGDTSSPNGVSACATDPLVQYQAQLCGSPCTDGSICVALEDDTTFFCAPYDIGVLFAKNGAADRVRYADMGAWTGDPLPLPSTCPSIPGVQVCGGNCGPCPEGQVCTGRSPLHAYSFCAPQEYHCVAGSHDCGADAGLSGHGCLTFTVQADAQAVANKWGLCLPATLCQAVAAGLPGGATCSL